MYLQYRFSHKALHSCHNQLYVYMDGSVVRAHESQRTTSSDPDERTFAIIQEMGNAIHTSIQLTKDVPSANEDSKVPILDLKCWTDQMTTEDGRVKCQIPHEFIAKQHY